MHSQRSLSFVRYSEAAGGYLPGSMLVTKARRPSGVRNLLSQGVEVAVVGPRGNVIPTCRFLRDAESLLLAVAA